VQIVIGLSGMKEKSMAGGKRNLTPEQNERAELREMVDSTFWSRLVEWLAGEEAALNRAWPNERDEKEVFRLQGELRRIHAILGLKKRLHSDDAFVKKVNDTEE
jgi:hypothetical protein